MKKLIQAIDGFYTNAVYCSKTYSIYFEKKTWDNLDKAGLVGKNLLQGENNYTDRGMFCAFLLAPKLKYFSSIKNYGVDHEHKRYKHFNNVSET